jgi:hypothetical protein
MIFPHRVAWLIGWRFALAPHQATIGTECQATNGAACSMVPMPSSSGSVVDDSMLFQSSLEFTF